VDIAEYAMLLNPNALDGDLQFTTQDGILTDGTVPSGSSLTYGYGDFVAQGILSLPPWWCSEERQFVRSDTQVFLGGEIAPFGMEPILADVQPDVTQNSIWAYLRENPSPVIGKTVNGGFWGEIPELEGQSLAVGLRATNLAISDLNDALPEPVKGRDGVPDLLPVGRRRVRGIDPHDAPVRREGRGHDPQHPVAAADVEDVRVRRHRQVGREQLRTSVELPAGEHPRIRREHERPPAERHADRRLAVGGPGPGGEVVVLHARRNARPTL